MSSVEGIQVVPKMPHYMSEVYRQIHAHKDYATKGKEYEFGIAVAETGMSWCTKKNNKWIRKIWTYLYLNGPKP
jgi:hypothetical protein